MEAHRLLVAIVDDEEPVRKALRRLLLAAGIDVETFASGDELLESVKIHRPDCAVIDLHLPGLTGLEVQQRLARAGIRLPTIIITGHDQSGTAERALAAGASAYLHKPLDEERLLAAIESAVREARYAGEVEMAGSHPWDQGLRGHGQSPIVPLRG
jgi:FixJ family two-component response regulator